MNAVKTFVDTNVLIYAFTSDEPDKQAIALKYIDACLPVISTQVLKEFSNVLIKRGGVGQEIVKNTINEIINIAIVINEEPTLILNAIDMHGRYNFSFYDSLIIAAAAEAQCKVLLSEDLHDGLVIEGKLSIVNPFRGIK